MKLMTIYILAWNVNLRIIYKMVTVILSAEIINSLFYYKRLTLRRILFLMDPYL